MPEPDGESPDGAFAHLAQPGDVVAIVGAGGKTTTMFALAAALASRGLRVVTTKSTRIHRPTLARSPRISAGPRSAWSLTLPRLLAEDPVLTVVLDASSERAWDGVPPEAIDELRQASGADVVIVEADGARSRLLKAPAAHEPAMPPNATVVLPVAALSAVGRPLGPRTVHRPELAALLLGVALGAPLATAHVAALLSSSEAGLKRVPEGARVWPVLTRADAVEPAVLDALVAELLACPRLAGWVRATGVDGGWRYRAMPFVHA
ncbi:MAG: putative selenium-dependent hydroxylase accessory protein YqeC [Actinobacteria bacterium]|nr:putative selenium-dependent hydroxylase accessory protein YqeC [Actinomycetota bacterium]